MDAGLLLQYALVAIAVAASAAYVFKSQWPGAVRRLRVACAVPLLRAGRAPWVQRAGRWIAPPVQVEGGACSSGCDGCGPAKA